MRIPSPLEAAAVLTAEACRIARHLVMLVSMLLFVVALVPIGVIALHAVARAWLTHRRHMRKIARMTPRNEDDEMKENPQ